MVHFTKQVCDGVEIQWCGCCTYTKIFVKNNIFYLKYGGDLLVKITGERCFSHDLNQDGIELPATYNYTSTDLGMHSNLLILVGEAMKG